MGAPGEFPVQAAFGLVFTRMEAREGGVWTAWDRHPLRGDSESDRLSVGRSIRGREQRKDRRKTPKAESVWLAQTGAIMLPDGG
jgi:hypothetical protein